MCYTLWILVLIVVPTSLSGPVERVAPTNSETCSTSCPERSIYRYVTGTTYQYKYEAETRTTMAGAAEDTATITISAMVKMTALGPCDMVMSVSEVVVKRSHEEEPARMVFASDMTRARRALEKHPLRFAFHDGVVTDLCPNEGEDLWALNVKRGVLTSFQSSMKQLDREEHVLETDVTGRCPTHYQVTQKGWQTSTVTKVKDMLSCTDRHAYRTAVHSVPYAASNSLQSLPLLKSSHECQQEVEVTEGLLRSSTCQELHVFRPFSKGNNGAQTETSQKLTFLSKAVEKNAKYGSVSRRVTLLMDHKHGRELDKAGADDVRDKLRELCDLTKMHVRPQVPQVFGQLVQQMRSLSYSDLTDLERQIQRKTFCPANSEKTRKFFLDALPMAASGATLKLMTELLISTEVKDTQATFWLTSLAFASNPSKDMLAAVTPLLSSNRTQGDSMLAVSTLVNNYCEDHPQCVQDAEVQDILAQITSLIPGHCQVTDNNLKQVLLALRAVGNIGRLETTTLHLQRCVSNTAAPMDVRVAAVDAFRRVPCSADRTGLMEVYRRDSEDTELRISAYLAVMKCPSEWVIDQVRQTLTAEKVNQVGSFVWTHLTNLMEADSPHRQALRHVLEDELLQKEFNLDRRKFSRNYELSFFSDKFSVGGTYENNIIWSAGSFIPRSTMFNLTVDVFGRSLNLLEVGGRVQGLEQLLYRYFGPSGHHGDKDGGYGSSDVISQEKMAATRRKLVQAEEELRAQVYVRLMGNELAYRLLEGGEVQKLREGKASAFVDDLINRFIKDGQVSLTQSAVFLDSALVVPTALGLPLNLTVNGSVAIEIDAKQNLDLKKLSAKSQAFEIQASMEPSAAVEVVGMMSIDAFVTQVGLKMTSTLHTSTAVKGRMELSRGQIFSVEIDAPRDNLQVFGFQSKFHIVHDTYEKEQKMITANRQEKHACSGEELGKVLGLELCTLMSFPNASMSVSAPYFPFTGPSTVSVVLSKRDLQSGYRLLAKQIQTGTSLMTQVALDTPGSKADRAVSLGLVVNTKLKTVEVDLLSPWKKVATRVAVSTSKSPYKVEGSVTVDGSQHYNLTAAVDQTVKKDVDTLVKLKPSLLVSGPRGVMMALTAALDYREGKQLRLNANLEMKDTLEKPINLAFDQTMKERKDKVRYKSSLRLGSQFATVKVTVQATGGPFNSSKNSALLTVSSKLDYNLHAFPTVRRNLVDLDLKLNDRSTTALNRYDISLNVDAKRTPEYNLLVDGQVTHKKSLTELEVKVRHGEDVKVKADKSKQLLLAGMVSHNVKGPKAAVQFELKAVYPHRQWEYEVLGKHEHNESTAEDYLNVRYAKGKSVDVHLLLHDQRKERKKHATFDLSYPAGGNYTARDVKINADYIEKSSTHHVVSALVSLQKGEKSSIVLALQRPTDDSVKVSADLNLHTLPPMTLEAAGNLALRAMKGRGHVTYGDSRYGLSYTSDIDLANFASFSLDANHPQRRVKAMLEGGRFDQEGMKRVKSLVEWDVDHDPSQKAGLTLELADAVGKKDINVGGMAELFLPVEGYHHLKGQLQLEKSSKRILTVAETVLGEDNQTYSVRFHVKLPITKDSFSTVVWLKSPHAPLKHVEAGVNHSLDASGGQLSTAVRGVLNDWMVESGVSGGNRGNLVVRVLEGQVYLRSSILAAQHWRLTFNHRDSLGNYSSQALLHANGDQYSADLQAQFHKVHWQIRTDGAVRIRAPHLTSEVRADWKHVNSLHDVSSSVTLYLPQATQVQLEVAATANIVSNIYDASATLRGPWHSNGSNYVTQLTVHHDMTPKSIYNSSVKLMLEQDAYEVKHLYTMSGGRHVTRASLTMSKFPHYSMTLNCTTQHQAAPYMASVELHVAGETLLSVDVDVEKTGRDQYRSQGRAVLHLQNSVETITATGRHERRKGQWVSTGNLQLEPGKLVIFQNVLDFEKNETKMVKLKVDTPYEEMKSVELEYSHSISAAQDLSVSTSLVLQPIFDNVSLSLSWSNREKFQGGIRIDTPFPELPYLEVKGESFSNKKKRHSTLYFDYAPGQVFKIDSVYSVDLPRALEVAVNLSTPIPQLSMLRSHVIYQFTHEEISGKFKLLGPITSFEEFSTDFGHSRGHKTLSSHLGATLGPDRRWLGRADLRWQNEIDGTVLLETAGSEPWQLSLTHKGQSWHDFRTKAGFTMNRDKLECEAAYSDKDGRSGLFMLATPDPDIDFFKTTFFHKQTEESFQGRYTCQYGEESKPYELGLSTTYSGHKIAFATDLKTPHTEDFNLELGFVDSKRVEVKLLGLYGSENKIDTLVKYSVKPENWDVGAEFEYRIKGDSRDIGLTLKRNGALDNLLCQIAGKYMGRRVGVDLQLKQANKTSGKLDVRTNFQNYQDLTLAFDHSGDEENLLTNVLLRWQDRQEARGRLEIMRSKWRRVDLTATLDLPISEYNTNKLTYKHNSRKNKFSADAVLQLSNTQTIKGDLEFVDNSKLTVNINGPFKDFQSCVATGTWSEVDMTLSGQATVTVLGHRDPVLATYTAQAGKWPVQVKVQATTPFKGWSSVHLNFSHDGKVNDFTSSATLSAPDIGTVSSEMTFAYTSPTVFDGLWTLNSAIVGAQDLKLAAKSSETGGKQYQQQLIIGWELLKEMVLDSSVLIDQVGSGEARYKTVVSLTTPWSQARQLGLVLDHRLDEQRLLDTAMATYNDRPWLDVDLTYGRGEQHVGTLHFRQPRPMEYQFAALYTPTAVRGDLKVNWDKRQPDMNFHFNGDYSDMSNKSDTDKTIKVWLTHPVRTMGLEYVMKTAAKELHTDFLLTWDKTQGQTLSYIAQWTDRSSRFTSAYDGKLKVGVPVRSVQLEGAYSDTGRAQGVQGAVLWDADRDQNMKLGLRGQLDHRGRSNKVQLGLDLPFINKEYSVTSDTMVGAGNAMLATRTEFSYSPDPRKLLVVNAGLYDLSHGTEATNYSLTFGLAHPATDFNVSMTSQVGSSSRLCSVATQLHYLTSHREVTKLHVQAAYDRLSQKLLVEAQTPMKAVSIEGDVDTDRGNYNLQLTSREDGKVSQVTDLLINPVDRTAQLTYRYDKEAPARSLTLLAQLVTEQLLQAELYHVDNGQRLSEALATVRLNTSHVLHTRLNWRPSMPVDLKNYLATQLTLFSYSSSEALRMTAQAVGQEVETKYKLVMGEVGAETEPLLNHIKAEMQHLYAQLETTQRDLRRFYSSNMLHVQDLGALATQTFGIIMSGLQQSAALYRQAYTALQLEVQQLLEHWARYPMAQKYAALVQDLASGLKNSRQVLEEALNVLVLQLGQLSDFSYQQYLLVSRYVDRKLKGYTAALRSSPQYQSLARVYGTAQGALTPAQYQQTVEFANARLLDALNKLGLKDAYLTLVTNTRQLIADQFHDVVQRPEFQQVYIVATEVYQQTVWAYQYWQVEQNLQRAVHQLLELAKDVTLLEISRIKNAIVDLDKSRLIIFDPQLGEMQFEIYLPVSMRSLVEAPDLRVTKYINRLRAWAATYIPTPRQSLWAYLTPYMPCASTDTCMPPFSGHGYVMGDQYVVTFDGRHYRFAGRCSYVLARDMLDDHFTVVLDYTNRPRQPQVQTLLVLLRGVAIEVGRDNKVKVNGQETELPFSSGAVQAVRDRSLVRVLDGRALTVEVDNARAIISVSVSGWYHGRTAGLLGTYDHEPHNDMRAANGDVTDDAEALGNSWEVGRRNCRSRNLATSAVSLEPLDSHLTACSQHLNSSASYYAPCFHLVDPDEMVSACVELARGGESMQKAQCMAGHQYRYICRHRGLDLATPPACLRCQLSDGQNLTSDDSMETKNRHSPASADVVVVVEDSACNAWARQPLPGIATQLASALTQRGYTENRFGLVSYYGNGSAHVQQTHTIEGELFGQPGTFLKASERLRLTETWADSSVERALRAATTYPFRVGVAKLLVLVPCSGCGDDLGPVTSSLQARGFVLHLLSHHPFQLQRNDSALAAVKVFGLDSSGVHTQKAASRHSLLMTQQLRPPSDACAVMALTTNGSVFDVSHVTGRGGIQKEFWETFAARGAVSARLPGCERCRCQDDGTGQGRAVCWLCDHDTWLWETIPSWLMWPGKSVAGAVNDLHYRLNQGITALTVQDTMQT